MQRQGKLYRDERWARLDDGKTGELFDTQKDSKQYIDLFNHPESAETLAALKQKLKTKLSNITWNEMSAAD